MIDWKTCTRPVQMLNHLEDIEHPLLGDVWAEYLIATNEHMTCEFLGDDDEHVEAANAIRRVVPELESR